jgi:hypothetical protein
LDNDDTLDATIDEELYRDLILCTIELEIQKGIESLKSIFDERKLLVTFQKHQSEKIVPPPHQVPLQKKSVTTASGPLLSTEGQVRLTTPVSIQL